MPAVLGGDLSYLVVLKLLRVEKPAFKGSICRRFFKLMGALNI